MIYQDLWIDNGDLVLDEGHNPHLIQDRAVIAQDIKHAILESQLAVMLIAERSASLIADIKIQIELLVEDDVRLVPGTVRIEQPKDGTLYIFAKTRDFGDLDFSITQSEVN
ncbi:DUF2590 family protein [Photobacterium angustum]|uniref:DUF2590 domain-containing protein n=1 Tax=Photobacterium angustum TaxID=661 RepID=A0A855SKC1_PHOAN|nr:DUF2590 family protein [Photobacterium angustum]KJF83557.1 hypothetical protein UB36_03215 [Photobacterium damselae subsp. damselae]KJG42578.1 hypothetical protein UA35_00845 [Photobacterium angustum]KJG47865.1 hypothetical protein UA31_03215 [Photobacterium angustum]KJG49878.1 hypothetical protein UA30_04980 [Photobacterium angustum]KJG54030.1 hypothetical protein UA34_07175 [Photobacterium angustum]